jgi:hypothetical protein
LLEVVLGEGDDTEAGDMGRWATLGCCAIASYAIGCYGSNEATGAGESGLERSDEIGELAAPDVAQLCDWGVAIGAIGFAEVECPEGNFITAPSRDECVQNMLRVATSMPDCHATVGDLEPCFLAMGDDPCTGFDSAVCQSPPGCSPPPSE